MARLIGIIQLVIGTLVAYAISAVVYTGWIWGALLIQYVHNADHAYVESVTFIGAMIMTLSLLVTVTDLADGRKK